MTLKTVHLLLVEDDEVDELAFRRAMKEARVSNPITVARDGIEALEILRGTNGREALARPHITLLDLNMPRMNGLEFLQELRSDPAIKDSIVFVLTTSDDDRDRSKAYSENVAGFISKHDAGRDFANVVTMLSAYWRIVELP